MRSKESAADYRFIPEPDLPIIKISDKEISQLKTALPENPTEKLEKLLKKLKVDEKQANILTSNLELVEFFESVTEKIPPAFALDWVTIELLRVLNYNKTTLDKVDIKPQHFIELLELVKNKTITETKAKEILNKFIPKSFSPLKEAKSSGRIDDKKEIENIVDKIIKNNNKAVQDFKSGQQSALNFLMGQIMKETKGRADYKTALDILKEKLK